jgi:hypothetical protein
MLIEIWERLRGYDMWIQTEATIQSSEMIGLKAGWFRDIETTNTREIQQWRVKCVVSWTNLSSKLYTVKYSVPDSSRLFQLFEGEKVTIHYNPDNPNEYYFRDLFLSRARIVIQKTILILFYAGVLLLPSILRHK